MSELHYEILSKAVLIRKMKTGKVSKELIDEAYKASTDMKRNTKMSWDLVGS